MARVQHVQKANKKNETKDVKSNQQAKSKAELAKTNQKREPTKNEILFFRLGMSFIAITLITVAIIFTIQYFMNKDEEAGVFDDYISITANDLQYMMGYDENSGVYGDFTYFAGKPEYEDLFDLINTNENIYVYFYKSSDMNDDIVDAIKELDLEGVAFFLVDLDIHAETLSGAQFTHLDLDLTRSNLLLTFHVEEQDFDIELRVSDILRELGKL
ncbi:MAG: hypothetical protein WC992_06560 [Acholeplasmataceae bacterium]|jgi:hypothetical protein|nr:hypothetical protein [Acholeplasmataceae bacterium]